MKLYIVIWTKNREKELDKQAFRTSAEAITYANIESTQMETVGLDFNVMEVEYV